MLPMINGFLKGRLALAGLLLFSSSAWAQYEGDMPPDDGEAIYDGGAVAPYQPDDAQPPDSEPPQATEDFRRGSNGGGFGGGDGQPAFTGGPSGGGNFGGSQRKVEFRLVKEGNPRYNTNRKPRNQNY